MMSSPVAEENGKAVILHNEKKEIFKNNNNNILDSTQIYFIEHPKEKNFMKTKRIFTNKGIFI